MRSEGARRAANVPMLRKIVQVICCVHNYDYSGLSGSMRGFGKYLFWLSVPIKHLVGQLHLWWRGFRRVVLRRENTPELTRSE